jgi:hypothetical protein
MKQNHMNQKKKKQINAKRRSRLQLRGNVVVQQLQLQLLQVQQLPLIKDQVQQLPLIKDQVQQLQVQQLPQYKDQVQVLQVLKMVLKNL